LRDYGVEGQIGLENTPREYVEKLAEIFREVWRVLKEDGTLWLNLGDTYNHDAKWGGWSGNKNEIKQGYARKISRERNSGCKSKDLIGIPWAVAFALRSDGWYLRQDIIWHKPNPMPESVTDRCTKAHEYLFLLSKSERYYFATEAIKEKAAYAGQMRGGSTKRYEQNNAGMDGKIYNNRNKRSVWSIPTEPYAEAHFATFPAKLVEPCVLAGCPEGGMILDPFNGAGTTGLVATRFGRNYIGMEINPVYCEMARHRIEKDQPLFNCIAEEQHG